jgi:hypothetical protein
MLSFLFLAVFKPLNINIIYECFSRPFAERL